MASEQREEFERRLLARVRLQLDYLDEDYPNGGWEVDDFVVTAFFHSVIPPDQKLEPWQGGRYAGSEVRQFTVGSSRGYWWDALMLKQALDVTRRWQEKVDFDAAEDDEAAEDDD